MSAAPAEVCARCGAVNPYGDGCEGVVLRMHDLRPTTRATIAAAPQLAEALRACRQMIGDLRDALDQAVEELTDKSPRVRAWSELSSASLKTGMQAREALNAAGVKP